MVRGKLTIALITLIGLTYASIEIPKRAFRMYEKGDFVKTVDALQKSLAKDTMNPAAHYLYSVIYTDTAYVGYHVDSAFKSINLSLGLYGLVFDEKDQENLKDYGVDSVNLHQQKDLVDSLKFELVKTAHTVNGYNEFMTSHDDAVQMAEAIALRDHLAFEEASEMNIWQGYKSYMETYPEADDYHLADSLYKLLIYQDLTEDKTLKSYESFLEAYPQTPYRAKVEEEIYRFSTAINTLEAYTEFLTKYPNDSLAKKTLPRVYHIYKQKFGTTDFLQDFDVPTSSDSIKNIIALEKGYWIPKFDNGRYTFIDQSGQTKLISFFKELPADYLCQPVETDFIYGRINGHYRIQGRNGRVIYEGEFDQALDVGYGFIKIISEAGEMLIHKSGEVIIASAQQEITVLSNSLIKVKQNGLYGLTSVNGLSYLDTEFTAIEWFAGYLWLQKEEGIALIKPERLFPAITGEYVEIMFEYEDLDMLDNGRIWAQKNGQEGILDFDLREVIPYGDYEIYDEDFGWRLQGNQTTLIHDGLPELSGQSFDETHNNDRWLVTRSDSTWTLYDQLTNRPAESFEQVDLLGENMVMLSRNDSTWAQFKNGKRLLIEKNWKGQLLVPQNYIKTGQPAVHDFFMLSNAKKRRKIYNENGKEILAATYQEVTAVDPNMLRLQKKNTALVDSLGVFLLNFVYDGVGSNENGYLSILNGGKVGIINPGKNLLIPPKYTKLIEPYSDTVLVANDGDLKGFINKKGEELSAFDFDEVKYWNDSIALVRIENEWIFHDIATEEAIYEGMTAYELIHSDNEGALLKVTKESGQGLYHSTKGELIEPTFNQVNVLGSKEEPIYFTLKIVAEADLYIVIYYDQKGNKLFTQSLSQEDYNKIACN